jgi:hypothetical protein
MWSQKVHRVSFAASMIAYAGSAVGAMAFVLAKDWIQMGVTT